MLDGNYPRMLRAILNKSWRQHPTKQQLYCHQPPFTKTIKIKRTRHEGYRWRIKDELISDVLLWTSSHGRAKRGRPARTYIQQFCVDTGCSPEDLPEAMDDREGWRESVWDIRADGTSWWWWWLSYIGTINQPICVYSWFINHLDYTLERSCTRSFQSIFNLLLILHWVDNYIL